MEWREAYETITLLRLSVKDMGVVSEPPSHLSCVNGSCSYRGKRYDGAMHIGMEMEIVYPSLKYLIHVSAKMLI